MLHFPPILAGKRNWMHGFHRPSKMRFLIFCLQVRLLSEGLTFTALTKVPDGKNILVPRVMKTGKTVCTAIMSGEGAALPKKW